MMNNLWLNQGIGFLLGVASGLFVPIVSKFFTNKYHRLRSKLEKHHDFHAEEIKFLQLNAWSERRQLTEDKVMVSFDDRPWDQNWCDDEELKHLKNNLENQGGSSSTLRSISIDHRESESGQQLKLSFAPSMYGDLISVAEYFRRHPDGIDHVLKRFSHENTKDVIHGAPQSVASMNVTIMTADLKLLAVHRSGAVQTSPNAWTLGPNETMLGAIPASGGVETPFELARRCLDEEVNLAVLDSDRLQISWVGYDVPNAQLSFVAHFRTHLRSSEVEQRMAESHASFEFDQIAWIPANNKTVHKIISSIRSQKPDEDGRLWFRNAALAAHEWRRWRRAL